MNVKYRELDPGETRAFEALFSTVWPDMENYRELIEWAFRTSPLGPGIVLGAFPEDRPTRAVGARGSMVWPLHVGTGENLRIHQFIGTCTHPDYRRLGIFSRLNLGFLERLEQRGGDAVFNVSVPISRAGYEKLGWRYLPGLRRYIRVVRPIQVAMALVKSRGRLRGAVSEVEREGGRLPEWNAIEALADRRSGCLAKQHHTAYDESFFRWRFADKRQGYRFIVHAQHGMCVYRVLKRRGLREVLIGDLWLGEDPGRACAALMRQLWDRESPAMASLLMSSAHPWLSAVRSARFRADPKGDLNLGVRTVNDRAKALLDADRWAIMMADIDTF